MAKLKYDFAGWATMNNVLCADGRTIRKDAFKDDNGRKVPLVWNHQHNDPDNVLGHALLENRPEGVWAYGVFNSNPKSQRAKQMLKNGDIDGMSIMANRLQQVGSNVVHGVIREVSLVLSGANPGALIEEVVAHSDEDGMTAEIYNSAIGLYEGGELEHAEETSMNEKEKKSETSTESENKNESSNEETVADVINTMNEKQKNAMFYMIGEALKQKLPDDEEEETSTTAEHSDESGETFEEGNTMHHNVFEGASEAKTENVLTHAEQLEIINDAKKHSDSLKETVLAHGIEQVDWLFPEAKNPLGNTPGFVTRQMDWVNVFKNAVHHTPFSRVKSMFADLTEDEARALGYIKGKMKKEQVFTLLKRTTDPTTIYKKQKMHRDDVLDITDFDVVAWLKGEMRFMLDEEIYRAALVGDGRLSSSDDKIPETNVRPIWTDDDLYTIHAVYQNAAGATADDNCKAFIRAAAKARKDYRGSGSPILFTTEDLLSDFLLMTDTTGRDLYPDEATLARKLRVSRIVTVPVMEGLTRDVASKTRTLQGIIVNPIDYNIGADRGGAVNMFDDFDINYNQMIYLIETRCSGALIRPYSAIAIESEPNT